MIYKDAEFHNIAEILDDGRLLSRIPLDLRAKLNPKAQERAIQAAGCEIRFNLRGASATITLGMTERPAIAEVYHGPFLTSWHVVDTVPTDITATRPDTLDLLCNVARAQPLPFDPRLVRVILPWRPPVQLLDLRGSIASPHPGQVPERRMVAYGSSITHGNNSVSPTGSYATRLAQRLGVDLINLGFGGGAYLEPEVADYIAGRGDWDLAILELGINVIEHIDVPTFEDRVARFLDTITSAHPEKWVFCIDMYPFAWDFDSASRKQHAFRAVVRDAVASRDLPRLVHVDGRGMLERVTGLSSDLVHPSPQGMDEIAQNLAALILAVMSET